VDARSRKCSEASEIRADGVVLIKFNQLLLTNTHPGRSNKVASQFFLDVAATPPLLRRGFPFPDLQSIHVAPTLNSQ